MITLPYTVGVLISRHIFRDCLQGKSPYEVLQLYHQAAQEEGLRAIFFTPDHLSMTSLTVQGFEKKGKSGFVQQTLPIPRVIHNRLKPVGPEPVLIELQNHPYIHLFNHDNRLDKWNVYQTLSPNPALRPHLPETYLFTADNFEQMKHQPLYLKPRDKSLGMGVRKLHVTESEIQITHSNGQKEKIPWDKRMAWVQAMQQKALLIQQAISLLRIEEQLIDIRVAVQRNRLGVWQVSGMVTRVGPAHGIATNVAVGGKAKQLRPTLQEAGIAQPDQLIEKIRSIVLIAAEELAKTYNGLADLGFDIAIDEVGKVWIIEVNGRDLRITFNHAKDLQAWEKTFTTPMRYAAYLLEQKHKGEVKHPSIAIVTPGNLPVYDEGSGSVEITAREIAKEVSKLHSVYLVGTAVQTAIPSITNVQSVTIQPSNRDDYLDKSIRTLRLFNPDIIQVENRPLWINKLKKHYPQPKKVLFLHSETYIQPPYAALPEVWKSLTQYDLLITNSQFMHERLSKLFPTLASKIKVVRLGVDLNHFASIHDPLIREQRIMRRQEMGLGGRPVLLFVGRLIPEKGVHHLIEAFHKVQRKHPEVVLLIVGSSFYGKEIETPYVKKCKESAHRFGDSIRWIPHTSHRDLPALYQLADVLVTPTTCTEAFGLVNVEGMATGLPILSTRTGGIGEVVEDEVNGRLLSTVDLTKDITKVLKRWLKDPKKLKEMGRESRKRAEELFSWSRVAEELSELYRKL